MNGSASAAGIADSGRLIRAATVLGLALSGFFDGILLHQILKWHHFLSLAGFARADDLARQVTGDGIFHAIVYATALLGLALLWRARAALTASGAGIRVFGGVLLGFGLWNMLDVALFHWVLRFHRVRIATDTPLFYDLAWLIGPGLLVAAIGAWLLARAHRAAPGDGDGAGKVAGIMAALAVLVAAPVAGLPSPGGPTLVLFPPGLGPAAAINAVVAAEARLVMIDPAGRFAIVETRGPRASSRLYGHGAWLVTASPALAGCVAFAQVN